VKTALLVLAAVMLLLGLVWMGQGLGYVKGSFMTGQMMWFWVGLALVVGSGVLAGVRRAVR
jgi:hypothetical protein